MSPPREGDVDGKEWVDNYDNARVASAASRLPFRFHDLADVPPQLLRVVEHAALDDEADAAHLCGGVSVQHLEMSRRRWTRRSPRAQRDR
jgi:hypothetical protein